MNIPDYSSNSRNKNEAVEQISKLAPVANGKPIKKSVFKEFKEAFFTPEDRNTIISYIITEVAARKLKEILLETVTYILDGEPRKRGSSNASRISYQNYYRNNDRNVVRTSDRSTYDFDDIRFDSLGEAEMVLDAMNDAIAEYGLISVAGFYDLSNYPCDNHAANKYGWKNIGGCKAVRQIDGGYILDLPRAKPLD